MQKPYVPELLVALIEELFRELKHEQGLRRARRRQSATKLLAQHCGDPQAQPGIGDVEVGRKFDVLRQDTEPDEIAGAPVPSLMRRRPCSRPATSWPGAASAWPRRLASGASSG
jgi:hypothetical protein